MVLPKLQVLKTDWPVWSLTFLPTARASMLDHVAQATCCWVRKNSQDGSLMALGHEKGVVEADNALAALAPDDCCMLVQVLRFPSLQPLFRERHSVSTRMA